MSDVQSSTPYYRVLHRPRQGSNPTLMYDSDSRARRHAKRHEIESSDSSEYVESVRKLRSLETNIQKPKDSMRVL